MRIRRSSRVGAVEVIGPRSQRKPQLSQLRSCSLAAHVLNRLIVYHSPMNNIDLGRRHVLRNSDELGSVWEQASVPVIVRRSKKGQLHWVRLPYSETNRSWLRNGRRSRPDWVSQSRRWEIPKAWFNDFVERSLRKFGRVFIIQPFREQEKCAPACMNAEGHECQCSCMGANHGAGNDGSWFEVSEAFATRWNQEEWACRLLVAK